MRATAVLIAFFSVGNAFVPSTSRITASRVVVMSSEGESRRSMLTKGAGALGLAGLLSLSGSSPAFADGAVSLASVARARGKYGARIEALSNAVDKGDFDAIEAEKNAFILFNSGVYAMKGPLDKRNKKIATDATNALFSAVSSRDKAAAKAAYNDFIKVADIQPGYTGKDKEYTQGYSSEYDWKYKDPKKGTIYIR